MALTKEKAKEQREQRIGMENTNILGTTMKIVEYINSTNIVVQFLDEFREKVNTTYVDFKKGNVKNPYGRYASGVGIIGYENIRNENGKLSIEYETWKNMLRRCYNNFGRDRDASYLDCTVNESWHLFKNFKEWMQSQENYEKWKILDYKGLDKDILIKGNKIYSHETCCLVPGYVNNLFTKHDKKRGKYCIGVNFHKRDKVFEAHCNNPFLENKSVYLGRFKTEESAFNAYKNYKENIIKQAAQEEYNKGNITKQCYEAMMNYQVEITD